jgi:uncharacterized membrane protein YdjX (TVP38/TMEM64 family)
LFLLALVVVVALVVGLVWSACRVLLLRLTVTFPACKMAIPWLEIAKWTAKIVVISVVILLSALGIAWLTKEGYVLALLEWVARIGWPGYCVMVVLLICVHIPFMFGYAVTGAACGFLYGFLKGSAVIIVGCGIGCNVGYVITVLLMKRYITEKVQSGRPELKALMAEINTNPWKISLVVRFIPIPIGFQNAILAVCV